jgi:hypothetical protein
MDFSPRIKRGLSQKCRRGSEWLSLEAIGLAENRQLGDPVNATAFSLGIVVRQRNSPSLQSLECVIP